MSARVGTVLSLPGALVAELVGRHFDDATVLRAGHAYEQVRGRVAELQLGR